MALPLRFRDMLCECLVCCYTTQRYTLSFFVACVIAAAHLSSNEPSLSLSRVCLKGPGCPGAQDMLHSHLPVRM